mmetsp:Transcript_173831/g.557108  ORF Transcript_173831/g.557108 Transcript_173831/m.557108 type:complete len:269 (-) Transcript_173831:106-912(-)
MGTAEKLYYPDQVPFPRDPSFRPPLPPPGWLRALHWLCERVLRLPQGSDWAPEKVAHSLRRELYMTTVNARRLHKLPINMEEALGHPPWLERAQPMLWSGAVGAWWHNDEPDNLLISLNKEINVAVFDAFDTDHLSGSKGPVHLDRFFDLGDFHPDKDDSGWLANNTWLHKFPFIRVRLSPGMGVVVPSRAYHAVWAEDADRLLLNCFMFPRYKVMEDAPSSSFSFFGRGRQPSLYMALFHLKVSSIARLWDMKKLGGFFEMVKLEFL